MTLLACYSGAGSDIAEVIAKQPRGTEFALHAKVSVYTTNSDREMDQAHNYVIINRKQAIEFVRGCMDKHLIAQGYEIRCELHCEGKRKTLWIGTALS